MAVDIDTVKNYIGNDTNDFDSIITNLINYAYSYINQYVRYDSDTGVFSEYRKFLNVNKKTENNNVYYYFDTIVITKDINLTSFLLDTTDLIDDVDQVSDYEFRILWSKIEDFLRYKISYTSVLATSRIDKIITDIIIWELNQLPVFNTNNILIKKSTVSSFDNNFQERYYTKDEFYNNIHNDIMQIIQVYDI